MHIVNTRLSTSCDSCAQTSGRDERKGHEGRSIRQGMSPSEDDKCHMFFLIQNVHTGAPMCLQVKFIS